MADLAEEVLRRKDTETLKRGGVPPSPDDIKMLCASVLNEYKNSSSCGTDCASKPNMLVNTSEQHNESSLSRSNTGLMIRGEQHSEIMGNTEPPLSRSNTDLMIRGEQLEILGNDGELSFYAPL